MVAAALNKENSAPEVRIEAGQILREIVSEIVLRPGNERGGMLVEVRGDPSARYHPRRPRLIKMG